MLKLDAKNKESLECIQQALFCVALDESSPTTSEEVGAIDAQSLTLTGRLPILDCAELSVGHWPESLV